MGKERALSVGMDVGSHLARLVVLSHGQIGDAALENAAVADLPQQDAPVSAIRRLCRQIPRRSGKASCNLGPVAVIVHHAEFPAMPNDELRAAARIEAEQLIPDIDEMVVDFQVLGSSAGADDEQNSISALIIAAPKSALDERVSLLESAGVPMGAVVPDGIALANAVAVLQPPVAGAVLAMDLGQEATNLVALAASGGGAAPVARFIQGGAALLPGADETEDVAGASERERWLREVERSIQFVNSKLSAGAERILVVGSGSENQAALQWIEQMLQLGVTAWNPLADLSRGANAPDDRFIARYGPYSAIAVGLALMGGP